MRPENMREKQVNIRLNEDEAARVERVAGHHGINAAALFRMLVMKEARALGLADAPAVPITKKKR